MTGPCRAEAALPPRMQARDIQSLLILRTRTMGRRYQCAARINRISSKVRFYVRFLDTWLGGHNIRPGLSPPGPERLVMSTPKAMSFAVEHIGR